MFVHLHNHSHYSLLEGLSSPKALAKQAKELGQPGIALTDKSVMYGAVEFYKACKDLEIKPVIGCEFYVAQNSRLDMTAQTGTKRNNLILIAYNHAGYKNLLTLSTKAFIEGFYYKPRIDKELLKEYNEGLLCLSSDIWGELPQAIIRGKSEEELLGIISEHQDIFGKENYFLEMMHHPHLEDQAAINARLIQLHKDHNLPLVVTNNTHYAKPEQKDAHEIILCIQTGKDFDDPSRFTMREGDYSLRTEEDLRSQFPDDLSRAFDNTVSIMERCHYDFVFGKNLIPAYKIPETEKSEEYYFRKLCWEGALDRYHLPFTEKDIPVLVIKAETTGLGKELTKSTPEELKTYAEASYTEAKKDLLKDLTQEQKEIVDRLEYEMCVINEMGFCTYFLIVGDFVNWAKDQGIAVGPGRGSAAGAIVTYVLKITDLDPLPFSLLFERFLNPARVSMPDIDMDFEDVRRGEVLDYVTHKYGKLNVAQMSTFGTMKAKQAVKDVGRSLGIPYQEMDLVAKKMTEKLGTGLKEIMDTNPEIIEVMKDDRYKRVFDLALQIEGVVRQFGVHACGVVISEKELTEYTALQYPPKDKKYLVTQYSMKPIEGLGLLKMDFLGLRNLTILREAVEIIKRTKGVSIDVNTLPYDDKKTYELFARGDTKGVFQFESEGMRKWLKELKPNCFEDIIAMVSMYRPGPMAWIPVYIGKKHNLNIQFPSKEDEDNFIKLEKVLDKYPEVKKILENTNLIPIYQEQILQLAQKFSGFSLGGADLLRRAIGKKIASELMAQKEKFIEGAQELGNDPDDAKFLFERGIEPFADYGFNKSHAACYALVAYQTGYLKAHYPTEFMTALISTVEDNTEKLVIQIEDCSSMNIEILAPDFNESRVHFTAIRDGEIRFGLNAIKGFGEEAAKKIVAERDKNGPFTTVEDFLSRIPQDIVNRKSLEALILSGSMECLHVDRKILFVSMENLIAYAKERSQQTASGQLDIFGLMDDTSAPTITYNKAEPSTILERLFWERQILGFYVTGHPLQGLGPYMKKTAKLIEDFTEEDVKKSFTIIGFVSKVKKIMTKNKDLMAYMTVEGISKSILAIAFPKTYTPYAPFIQEEKFVKLTGNFDIRNGEAQFLIKEIKGIHIDAMIANATKDGTYNPKERASLGITPLAFVKVVEEVDEEGNVIAVNTVPTVQEQETAQVQNSDAPFQENTESEEPEETTPLFTITLTDPNVEILAQLKKYLSELEKGNTQVVLEIQGKSISTPYSITITEQIEKDISTIVQS